HAAHYLHELKTLLAISRRNLKQQKLIGQINWLLIRQHLTDHTALADFASRAQDAVLDNASFAQGSASSPAVGPQNAVINATPGIDVPSPVRQHISLKQFR